MQKQEDCISIMLDQIPLKQTLAYFLMKLICLANDETRANEQYI